MTQSSKPDSVIKTEGFAVFKKDKLIGYLNSAEARGVLWATDDVDKGIIVVPYKSNKQSIEIMNSHSKMKTTFRNGKPEVQLNIAIKANVGSVVGPIDLSEQSVIRDLEKRTNQTVKNNIEKVIKKVQDQYGVDIFGFGEALGRQHPKEWKNHKGKWEKEFKKLKVNIIVDTVIGEIGLKNRSFEVDMKGKK